MTVHAQFERGMEVFHSISWHTHTKASFDSKHAEGKESDKQTSLSLSLSPSTVKEGDKFFYIHVLTSPSPLDREN